MSETTLWIIAGAFLCCIELLTGTLAFLFLGVTALLVAALSFFEIGTTGTHFLIFGLLSVLSFIFVRKRLLRIDRNEKGFHSDAKNILTASTDIEAGQTAVLSYQGAPWQAMNTGKEKISNGDQIQILHTDGNKLLVEKRSI